MRGTHPYFILFLKGVAMGAANVIPGISGGTVAFITGIYEKLIESLKSFDFTALKLLARFKIKELFEYVNVSFLLPLMLGAAISLLSLGRLLDYLFIQYPIHIWAFFFGLIAASVVIMGKAVDKWKLSTMMMLVLGTLLAYWISTFKPLEENDSFLYLTLCGVVAVSSMILPGLSGSFVLILLGNYQLIMLKAVPNFNVQVIIPVAIGSLVGFLALSRIIDYMLKKFKESTIALLTGFVLGSLFIVWPWKKPYYLKDELGQFIFKKGEKIVQNYDKYWPELSDDTTLLGFGLIIIGALSVLSIEYFSTKENRK